MIIRSFHQLTYVLDHKLERFYTDTGNYLIPVYSQSIDFTRVVIINTILCLTASPFAFVDAHYDNCEVVPIINGNPSIS